MKRLLFAVPLAGAALLMPPAQAATVRLSATLSGLEIPRAGDRPAGGDTAATPASDAKKAGQAAVAGAKDRTGTLSMTISTISGYVCYSLVVQNTQFPAFGSIHAGAAGQTGPAEIPLDVTRVNNDSCGKQDIALLNRILANPAGYYVSVRNARYPGGALRGQLERK